MKYLTLTRKQVKTIYDLYNNNDEQILLGSKVLENGDIINLIARKDRYDKYINIRLYWTKDLEDKSIDDIE